MTKLREFFAQVLPLKPQPKTTLTTTKLPAGEWNSGLGTRKELEESAKKMRKKVKREKVIWERYVNAVKAQS